MNDLISRQEAIDALAKFVPYAICDESTESYTNGLTDAYNLICQLPSAEPVKHGKWIVWDEIIAGIYHTVSECSECGFTTDKMSREEMPYCPNCGADMRGESE